MGVNHLLKLRGWLGDVPSFLDYLEWFSIKAKFFGAQNKTMNLLGLFQTHELNQIQVQAEPII